MKKTFFIIAFYFLGFACGNAQLISETKQSHTFSLSEALIYVDSEDYVLIKKSAVMLQQDIEMVTGKKLPLIHQRRFY
jgi:hypothetical protein